MASIALNTSSMDVTDDTGAKASGSLASRLKSGLLNRVKQVGENLRNTTKADVAFLAASIGAGMGAKTAAIAGLGLLGATGGVGLAAVGVALAGGAAAGLAKAGVKHIQAVRKGSDKKFFSRETLMSTASTAAISAATLGLSEALEYFTGHSLAETIGNAFHKASKFASHKLFDLMPGSAAHAQTLSNLPRPMGTIPAAPASAPVAAPVSAPVADAAPSSNIPKPMQVIPAAATPAPVAEAVNTNIPKPVQIIPAAAAPVAPVVAPVVEPVAAPVADTVSNVPKAMATIPAAPVETPTAAPVADVAPANLPKPVASIPAQPAAAPVTETVQPKIVEAPVKVAQTASVGENANIDGGVRERARAWARAMNPLAKAVPDAPAAPVAPAPVADVPKPLATVKAVPTAIAPSAPVAPAADEGTALDRARKWMATKGVTPQPAAASAVTDKVVTLKEFPTSTIDGIEPQNIVLNTDAGAQVRMPAVPNLDAELKTVNDALRSGAENGSAAVQLNAHNMAGACVTDLPKTQAAFAAQSGVLPNTCVIAAGKDTMAAGDYVIVRDAAEPAPSAKRGLRALFASSAEKTSDFISRIVGNETLREMSAEKLATAAPAP